MKKNIDVLNKIRFINNLLIQKDENGSNTLRKFNAKFIYALNKNLNILQNAYKPCEDSATQIQQEYGEFDKLSEDKKKELNGKLNELLDMEVEIEGIHKVSIDLLSDYDFDITEINALDFMIE